MQNNIDQQYLIEKGKSESPEDLIGKFLLQLIQLQNAGNQGLNGLNNRQFARHEEIKKYLGAGLAQGGDMEKLLADVKNSIDGKEVDLSEVVAVLSQILNSNSALGEALMMIGEQHPEIVSELAKIAELLRQNKPQNEDIVASQDKMAEKIGKLLIELTEEVKSQEFPEEMKISGPVEISKPSWWKAFEFSWEPLKELVEKIKAHTFSVRVINPQEKEKPLDPNVLAKKIADALAKVIKSMPRSGGMGNPFDFDETGNLKVTSSGDESYKFRAEYNASKNPIYIGYAEPKSDTNEATWQIRKFIYDGSDNLLEINWADGDRKFNNVWDNRASLNYN